MSLSSNWAKLEKSLKPEGGAKSKRQARRKKNAHTGSVRKRNAKSSSVMDMITAMNKAVEDAKALNDRERLQGISEVDSEGQGKEGRLYEVGKYVAMDCEFVGVGPEAKESALARVSMVNYHGKTLLDVFVRPKEKVVDWRTWVSGVRPSDMKCAVPFEEAQRKVAEILKERILVGHAISHDLAALRISHPRSMIRDTASHPPFRAQYAKGKTPSLKKLAKEVLRLDIQSSQHSSLEDAKAAMLLYKAAKTEFEKLNRTYLKHS